MPFTTQELIEYAQRELATRRSYPAVWFAGKQEEIEMMETIVGLLSNMESSFETNRVLVYRQLKIQDILENDLLDDTKLYLISETINPSK